MFSKIAYCPNCSEKLVKKRKNLFICNNCDFHYYINPVPANAIILENAKGEILLAKRKFAPKKGYWDLPGGFMDLNESMEQAVKRELKEELGIGIKNFSFFHSYADRYLYKGINYHIIAFTFIGKIGKQKLAPKDDVSEIAFFPPKKIPFNRIGFKGIKQALKDFARKN